MKFKGGELNSICTNCFKEIWQWNNQWRLVETSALTCSDSILTGHIPGFQFKACAYCCGMILHYNDAAEFLRLLGNDVSNFKSRHILPSDCCTGYGYITQFLPTIKNNNIDEKFDIITRNKMTSTYLSLLEQEESKAFRTDPRVKDILINWNTLSTPVETEPLTINDKYISFHPMMKDDKPLIEILINRKNVADLSKDLVTNPDILYALDDCSEVMWELKVNDKFVKAGFSTSTHKGYTTALRVAGYLE